MKDADIRRVLKPRIEEQLHDAVLFEELPLCRSGRADLAAVNCSLWGYEIKSARDTLNRLPSQILHYDRIFDFSIVVTAEKHLKYVRRIVPNRWGICIARGPAENVTIDPVPKIHLRVRLLLVPDVLKVRPRSVRVEVLFRLRIRAQLHQALPRRQVRQQPCPFDLQTREPSVDRGCPPRPKIADTPHEGSPRQRHLV
jgi:hypothetical protein